MSDPEISAADRRFGWWDMWTDPEHDPREAGGPVAGERDTLVRYLRDRRLTLVMKCEGLTAEQMARRSVPPSDLSLLGLVRHLTDVERGWFRAVMAGAPNEPYYTTRIGPGEAGDALVADAWSRWRAEVEFAERFVADAPDLGLRSVGQTENGPRELREIMIHMIEEYARHLGHADFLRERIDGRIGQ